jgi:hypothetical protein
MLYLQVAPLTFHKQVNYETSTLGYVAYSCRKQNKDMNEMIDAHAYEMQCNYGSQTPEVLQPSPLIKILSRDLKSVPLLIEFLITIT